MSSDNDIDIAADYGIDIAADYGIYIPGDLGIDIPVENAIEAADEWICYAYFCSSGSTNCSCI